MQTGQRAYSAIERKRRRRQWQRQNSRRISKRRRTSAKDRLMAMRQRGELPPTHR